MIEAVFAIPGALDTPTGGYVYDRRVMALLGDHNIKVHHLALASSFPDPGEADLAESARRVRAAPAGVLIFDGLAYGALPASLIAGWRRDIIALVHHPLGLETGLSEARRQDLLASERAALRLARHVIATSATTARTLVAQFGVPSDSITVAEPGTDPAPRAARRGDPLQILAVGSVVPRKGYDILVSALARVADRPWQAIIAGALDRAPDHAAAVQRKIAQACLSQRISFAGALTTADLERAYAGADLFVSASHYEGFGMVLTEALAHGLPIVTSTGGAADVTLANNVALKFAPGDVDALATHLARLLTHPAERHRLADAAWAHAASLPRWPDTAARVADVVKRVSEGASVP